uniref:Uncharacterized protein n=1 Tax=Aegilops tauschii subsp. strangulata TaxID=200361 RepID=A0A453CFG1_AEGTS
MIVSFVFAVAGKLPDHRGHSRRRRRSPPQNTAPQPITAVALQTTTTATCRLLHLLPHPSPPSQHLPRRQSGQIFPNPGPRALLLVLLPLRPRPSTSHHLRHRRPLTLQLLVPILLPLHPRGPPP